MNFKEIIKQEWEQEYPLAEGQEPYNFEDSLFSIYHELVEKICVRVHNNAIEVAADNAEADHTILSEDAEYLFGQMLPGQDYEVYCLKESILKHKL